MLARSRRISRLEFETLFTEKRSLFTETVSLLYTLKNTEKPSKFAVIVSKKVAKKAVQRNYLRRVVYTIIQKNDHIIQKTGCAGILNIKKGFAELSYEKKEETILFLLRKSGICTQ
ncbi:MAG: ribonuclease P protein component [Candidatus Pacebacteria bacterium]|nr:ribonuclease P protein component [Candidatus Paceibacterota bacterium]